MQTFCTPIVDKIDKYHGSDKSITIRQFTIIIHAGCQIRPDVRQIDFTIIQTLVNVFAL